MTLTDFLLARIAEDEAVAKEAGATMIETGNGWVQSVELVGARDRMSGLAAGEDFTWGPTGEVSVHPARVLAECEAKRRIVAFHESWPVLVEQPPTFDVSVSDSDSVAFRASQQLAWLTTQEYRKRFGDDPPTSPVLRALALPYADHPDYDEGWRV